MSDSPYKLYDFYTYEDRGLFFGREEESSRMVGEILCSRLLVLSSPSRSGKSSLINAGIRPLLEARGFHTACVSMGFDPETLIRQAVGAVLPLPSRFQSPSLHEFLRQSLGPKTTSHTVRPLVIFLDQFEKFFIVYRDDPQKRQAFIRELAMIRYDTSLPVSFVLCLDDEYFVNLIEFIKFIPSIFQNKANIHLRPLDDAGAERAIVNPAHAYDYDYEGGLSQRIISDLKLLNPNNDGVQLVKLQIICYNLWLSRDKREHQIKPIHYDQLGGAWKIIGERDPGLYQNLDVKDQKEQRARSSKRILIVEDNVALEGRPLEMTLQKAGYKVVGIAETENEAIEIARRERPSVVLMDIELVDNEGKRDRLAGLRAARKIQTTTGSQVIFITGIRAESDVVSEVQKTPGCEFLIKPVRGTQLLASVQLAIERDERNRNDRVFVCYSHKDSRYAEELMQHICVLEGFGIHTFIDSQIAPGRRWEDEINNALANARAAICLVSSEFIASEFINRVELPLLLKAEAERGLRVCPVFVNFVHDSILKQKGLLDFQGINPPYDPIATWGRPKRHQKCWSALCDWLQSDMISPFINEAGKS